MRRGLFILFLASGCVGPDEALDPTDGAVADVRAQDSGVRDATVHRDATIYPDVILYPDAGFPDAILYPDARPRP